MYGVKDYNYIPCSLRGLLREKKEGESFSDVILRLVKRGSDIMELAGC